MKKDITAKNLIGENDVFADISNVNMFDGKQVILPEDLESVPTEGNYTDSGGKHHSMFRDVIKKVNKLGGCIAFIGFENQADINNIMPVRKMGYDYVSYMSQIKSIMKKNREAGNAAFTKMIHDNQKLMPVATFVLYFGKDKWEKPLSLMDMLDISDADRPFWEELINDYRIRVIHMVKQSDKVISMYKSDFGVIASYLAYSDDENRLEDVLRSWPRKLLHPQEVFDMLGAVSNDKRYAEIRDILTEDEECKEECYMCKLLDKLENRGKSEGEANLSRLLLKLMDDAREEEFHRALTDKLYRDSLYEEYGIE